METPAQSWFGPTLIEAMPEMADEALGIDRLWQTLVASRVLLGLVLVSLQAALLVSGSVQDRSPIWISLTYLLATLLTRLFTKPRRLGSTFSRSWITLVGTDVIAFFALQWLQSSPGNNINYTPLFALPILVASVLGSLRLALGTAAGITMLLLGATAWAYLHNPHDATSSIVQAALSGAGYLAIAFLASQLSTRLVSEGQRARLNQLAARVQQQVNELVIESLADGVLVVDHKGIVRSANPSARRMLGTRLPLHASVFDLKGESGWQPLVNLMRLSVGTASDQENDVTIHHAGSGPRRLHIRTRLASPHGRDGESICVMFLQDQRELEAKMRTEKLASMGRMSTAVAHEIRNPLAAISQANALLEEDIADPRHTRLLAMVSQNAKRLDKIVDDILKVARIQPHEGNGPQQVIRIDDVCRRFCGDWTSQHGNEGLVQLNLQAQDCTVHFDTEHLRRVLVNLLDNAKRHASGNLASLQVGTCLNESGSMTLWVWSDGPPMDQSVERHLFEPFFSSESRSSGLGLYICRELCASHNATIMYQRNTRMANLLPSEGNEFVITFVPHVSP
jgi:two-component system sensor histidine kinase PilS (NtrC family)